VTDEPVLVRGDGRVARVLINRPAARNALSPAVLGGLRAAIDSATGAGCSVLVLRGAGGTLSAGADLKYLETILADAGRVAGYLTGRRAGGHPGRPARPTEQAQPRGARRAETALPRLTRHAARGRGAARVPRRPRAGLLRALTERTT
jgi:enoyl-CoA hydratase/carnithine racemase